MSSCGLCFCLLVIFVYLLIVLQVRNPILDDLVVLRTAFQNDDAPAFEIGKVIRIDTDTDGITYRLQMYEYNDNMACSPRTSTKSKRNVDRASIILVGIRLNPASQTIRAADLKKIENLFSSE